MGMAMKSWEWEGIGTRKSLPHISTTSLNSPVSSQRLPHLLAVQRLQRRHRWRRCDAHPRHHRLSARCTQTVVRAVPTVQRSDTKLQLYGAYIADGAASFAEQNCHACFAALYGRRKNYLHRVSKKTVHFCLCQNFIKFSWILISISFGR